MQIGCHSLFLTVSDFPGLRLCNQSVAHTEGNACARACVLVLNLLCSVLVSFIFFLSQLLINFTPNVHSYYYTGRVILSYHTISYTQILFTVVLVSCRPCCLQDVGHSTTSIRPPYRLFAVKLRTFNCTTSIRPPSDLSFVCRWVHSTARIQFGLPAGYYLCAGITLYKFNPANPSGLSFACRAAHCTNFNPASGRPSYHLCAGRHTERFQSGLLQAAYAHYMTLILPCSGRLNYHLFAYHLKGFNIPCVFRRALCTTLNRSPRDLEGSSSICISFLCRWVHSIVRLQSGLPAGYHLCAVIALYKFTPANPSSISFVCRVAHSTNFNRLPGDLEGSPSQRCASSKRCVMGRRRSCTQPSPTTENRLTGTPTSSSPPSTPTARTL